MAGTHRAPHCPAPGHTPAPGAGPAGAPGQRGGDEPPGAGATRSTARRPHGQRRRGAASRVRAGHAPGLGAHTCKQEPGRWWRRGRRCQGDVDAGGGAERLWDTPPSRAGRSPRPEGPREPAGPRLSSRPGPEPLPGTLGRSRRPLCRRASGPGAPTTPPRRGAPERLRRGPGLGEQGLLTSAGWRPLAVAQGARGALAARWRQADRAEGSRRCRPRPGPRLSRPPLPAARSPTSGAARGPDSDL